MCPQLPSGHRTHACTRSTIMGLGFGLTRTAAPTQTRTTPSTPISTATVPFIAIIHTLIAVIHTLIAVIHTLIAVIHALVRVPHSLTRCGALVLAALQRRSFLAQWRRRACTRAASHTQAHARGVSTSWVYAMRNAQLAPPRTPQQTPTGLGGADVAQPPLPACRSAARACTGRPIDVQGMNRAYSPSALRCAACDVTLPQLNTTGHAR